MNVVCKGGRHGSLAAVALLIVGLGSFGIGPSSLRARSACAEGGGDHIAIVIDFGTATSVPGAPTGLSVQCLAYTPGDTGLKLLNRTGLPVRFNNAGLVCAIGSYPASGCGTDDGTHYLYWSYWSGTADGWTYQQRGPAGFRAHPGVVEGWRFVDGASPNSGTGLAPPRNLTGGIPSFVATNICHAATKAPTPTNPPPNPSPSLSPPTPDAVPQVMPGTKPDVTNPSATVRPSGTPTTTSPSPSSTTPLDGVADPAAPRRFHTSDTAPTLSVKQVNAAAKSHESHSGVATFLGMFAAIVAVVVLISLGILRARHRAP